MSCSTISTGILAAMFLTRFETRSRSAAARPGQRLVQQQHLRLGAERDAEIDQPLPAIGQFAALDGLDAFEAEEFDQLRGLGVDFFVAVDVAPEVEAAWRCCACSDSRRFS